MEFFCFRDKLCGMLHCTNIDEIEFPVIGTEKSSCAHNYGRTLCKLVSFCLFCFLVVTHLSRMGPVLENSPLGAGFKQITFTNGKDFEKRVIKEVASNRLVLNQSKTK